MYTVCQSLSHLYSHVYVLIKIVPLVLACSNFSCKDSRFQLLTYVLDHPFFTPVFLWLTSQLHFLPSCPGHWNIPFKIEIMSILLKMWILFPITSVSLPWIPSFSSTLSLHHLNNKEMFLMALLADMYDPNSLLWWILMLPSFVEGSDLPPVVEAERANTPCFIFWQLRDRLMTSA